MFNKYSKKITLALMFSASGVVFGAPIHDAVYTNDIGRIQKAVREDPGSMYSLDQSGQTPIHIAILNNSIAGLTALMNNGPVNLNIQNQDGETPLVYAIKLNKYNPILFLLQKGSNPYYVDNNGRDALYYVKRFGDPSTKMIFDEVIKYQEEKLAQQKKMMGYGSTNANVAARTSPRITSKDGRKTVGELIAENAVQRELLGQTNLSLSPEIINASRKKSTDDLDDNIEETKPPKNSNFLYKNDIEDTVENTNSERTNTRSSEIEALAAQVEKLTELIKMNSGLPKNPVIAESSSKPDTEKTKVDSYNYAQSKVINSDEEDKIKKFIELNKVVGNEIPEKYSDAPKGPYTGMYKTQEKEELGLEKDVIPENWELTQDTKKDLNIINIPENGQKDALPVAESIIDKDKVIDNLTLIKPESIKKEDNDLAKEIDALEKYIPKTNEPEAIKDIPTMIVQKAIEEPKADILDKVKPLITEKQSKKIEKKINTESNKNNILNMILSVMITVLVISSAYGAILLFKIYKRKEKERNKEKELQEKEADENRTVIKSRLSKNNFSGDKKPE